MPFAPDSDGTDSTFEPLPPGANEPSDLDNNPRFLRLQNFRSRFLPGRRDIVVYLPEAYFTDPERRFPVFYLHDGQNLIDGRTSFVAHRTWQADTAADSLTRANEIEPVLLVGIANTGVRRMAEYTHTRDPRRGDGEGSRYGRLIVQELKPLIDHTFRTLTDPANTAIGGSSLGGLVSLSIALDYPDIFGKAAVLSPASGGISAPSSTASAAPAPNPTSASGSTWAPPKAFVTSATPTSSTAASSCAAGATAPPREPSAKPWPVAPAQLRDIFYLRIPNALHDESAWAARFPQVLRFLFPAHP